MAGTGVPGSLGLPPGPRRMLSGLGTHSLGRAHFPSASRPQPLTSVSSGSSSPAPCPGQPRAVPDPGAPPGAQEQSSGWAPAGPAWPAASRRATAKPLPTVLSVCPLGPDQCWAGSVWTSGARRAPCPGDV